MINAAITYAFILVTFVVLSRGIRSDNRSTKDYINNICHDLRVGLDRLRKTSIDYKASSTLLVIDDSERESASINWLQLHLAGEFRANGFEAAIANGKFIFLQKPDILDRSVPSSTAQAIPTILTSLGILGTFAGVSVGLSFLNLNAATDAGELIGGATQLIEGMKTAFYTSVAGMACSLLLMWIIRQNQRKKQVFLSNLEADFCQIGYLETSNHLLSRLNRSQAEQPVEVLREVIQKLTSFKDFSAESIGFHVAQAISPGFDEIHKDLAIQRETIEEQRKQITSELIRELRIEVVEPIADRLDKSVEITMTASQAVKQLREELGGISLSLIESVKTINTFQTETLEKLEMFAEKLRIILNDFRDETKGVLTQVVGEITSTIDQTLRGQTQIIRQTGEEATRTMTEARLALKETLSNIDTDLKGMRETVEEALVEFRNAYIKSLSTYLQEQSSTLSELLDKQRNGLEEAADQLRQVFANDSAVMRDNISKSMRDVSETSQDVAKLANSCGLMSSERLLQLQEIARTLGDQSSHIEGTYKNITEQFQYGSKALNSYLLQAQEIYEGSIRQADKSFADALGSLDQYSSNMIDVAERMILAADELHDTQHAARS